VIADFSAVLESTDLDEVASAIVRRASTFFACDAASLLLPDEDSGQLAVRAAVGLSERYWSHLVAPPIGAPPTHLTYVADIQASEVPDWALLHAEGLRSRLTAPLLKNGLDLGSLHIYSRQVRHFSESEGLVLTTLAHYGAQAIANTRRYQEDLLIKHDLEQAYTELLQTLTELERAQQRLVRTERLRALGELASGIAHDFSNLLAGILGNAQLLLFDADPEQRQLLEVIEQAALDGRTMVRRIAEFTNNRIPAPASPIDLTAVVDGALAITRPRWHARAANGTGITLRRDVYGPMMVRANPSELREVLINLIINALDAMPSGGTLTVRAALVAPNDDLGTPRALLEVADTGMGIDPAIRSQIFDPFFTTKPPEIGSGLGLAISKAIVEQHGGSIQVESEVGGGSHFKILLPLHIPDF
jgi:signal transduction histidine kinase